MSAWQTGAWQRSEVVDLTNNYSFRMTTKGIYVAEAGSVVLRETNGPALSSNMEPNTFVEGEYAEVRKAGTSVSTIYGLTDEPPSGPWQPDVQPGLIHWVTAKDPNSTATYCPDRAHGSVGGLTASGATSKSNSINGHPAYNLNGGRMVTPVGATNPMCDGVGGYGNTFVTFGAIKWIAQTSSDTLLCWGTSGGVTGSQIALSSSSGAAPLHHSVRRVNTSGSALNQTGTDTLPANGVAYRFMLTQTGYYTRLIINDTIVVDGGMNKNPVAVDRFVLGALLTNGLFAQVAKYAWGEMFTYDRFLEDSVIAQANAYLDVEWDIAF